VSSILGLDETDKDKNGWAVGDGLKIYFVTVRLSVDVSHEFCKKLVQGFRDHKHYKQMLFSVEKENAVGPCTHHIHAVVHFKVNVPKTTLKKWLDRFVGKHYRKDEGGIKHDYHPKAAIDVASCYCIKDDYLTKHETSEHYVGIDEFDLDSATADLPDQVQQTALQTNRTDRFINSVWISYTCAHVMRQ